jgi:hypothetical protein
VSRICKISREESAFVTEVDEMPDATYARRAALAALGLPEEATPGEITRSYRRLAKLSHPDATGPSDPDAARRFAALSEAYRALRRTSTDPALPGPAAPPAREPQKVTVRIRTAAASPTEPPPIVAGPVVITPISRPDR